jgi:hypothetical protein
VVFTHFMVMNAVLGSFQENPSLVCYQPSYCSILTVSNTDDGLSLVDVGQQSVTRIL